MSNKIIPLAPQHCTCCNVVKPPDAFYKRRGKPDSQCKECMRTKFRAYRETNKEACLARSRRCRAKKLDEYRAKINNAVRDFHKRHPGYYNKYGGKYSAARRARKKNAYVVEVIDREAIIERDKSTCYLCGKVVTGKEIHLDHVIPLSRDGAHTADNLKVACQHCNNRKWSKLLSELDWYKGDCT